MEIRTIASFTLLYAVPLLAQPILLESDLPAGTTSYQMVFVTDNGSSDPTLDGAGITWDFTSAVLDPAGSAFFGPPASTPFGASYPEANWAMTFDLFGLGQAYNYFRSTSSAYELIAEGVPAETVHYTDPKKFIEFPFEYQEIFSDAYMVDGVASNVSWQYTGYGTVITDLGTVNNVVKTVSSDAEIVFWHTQPLYPFISIVSGGIIVLVEGGVGVEEEVTTTQIVVHPNPVLDLINVKGLKRGDRYELLDALGRSIRSGTTDGSEILTLPIGDLASGNYSLRITNSDRYEVVKVIK